MSERLTKYLPIKAVLDLSDEPDSIDVKFYNNGNTAVFRYFDVTVEIVGAIERRQKLSIIFITVDNQTETFEIDTKKLAKFLELNLRFTLDHDENLQNLKAWAAEIPNIL
jgi:hypothetical protein